MNDERVDSMDGRAYVPADGAAQSREALQAAFMRHAEEFCGAVSDGPEEAKACAAAALEQARRAMTDSECECQQSAWRKAVDEAGLGASR